MRQCGYNCTCQVAPSSQPGRAAVEVGVRELRNNLSRYLDKVRDGEEVVVTDRGRAIARVLPIGGEQAIDRLIREGRVTPAKMRRRSRPRPVKTAGTVSDLIAEQRR
jgi:prevent-host-death family protein